MFIVSLNEWLGLGDIGRGVVRLLCNRVKLDCGTSLWRSNRQKMCHNSPVIDLLLKMVHGALFKVVFCVFSRSSIAEMQPSRCGEGLFFCFALNIFKMQPSLVGFVNVSISSLTDQTHTEERKKALQ